MLLKYIMSYEWIVIMVIIIMIIMNIIGSFIKRLAERSI